MFKICWACLYVSNELFRDRKLSLTSSFTTTGASLYRKSPTGKKEMLILSALKPSRGTLLKGYRSYPKCCHALAGARGSWVPSLL